MIKIFLLFFVTHGALCAPGPPFARYGPPQENVGGGELFLSSPELPGVENLQEKTLPQFHISPENLPGIRNLQEKSQLPENLPGIRNLQEKSQLPEDFPGIDNLREKTFPDTLTAKEAPQREQTSGFPNFNFEGAFRKPSSSRDLPLPQFSKPEKPVQRPELPVTRPELPLRRPELPVTRPELPLRRPELPVTRPELPLRRPELPVTRPELPLRRPELPVTRPELPLRRPELARPEIVEQQPGLPGKLGTPEYTSGEDILSDAIPGPGAQDGGGKGGPVVIPPGTRLKLEDDRGQYSHGFSSPDGTEVQESGRLITTNGGWEYVIAKEGSYKYVSPEGIPITARYIADHNGFRIISRSFGSR